MSTKIYQKREKMSNTLGQRLRHARRVRQITLDELSHMTGISIPSISRYERDERDPPVHAVISLSSALGLGIEWLVRGDMALREWDAWRILIERSPFIREVLRLMSEWPEPQQREAAEILSSSRISQLRELLRIIAEKPGTSD